MAICVARREGGERKELKAAVDNTPSFCEYQKIHILYFKIIAFIRSHLAYILILQSVFYGREASRPGGMRRVCIWTL